MKIKRTNLVAYTWKNCLNPDFEPMDARKEGWKVKEGVLVPVWYDGNNLPSDDVYDLHVKNTHKPQVDYESDTSDISDTESEYDSDEFAPSETYSTDEDDDEEEL